MSNSRLDQILTFPNTDFDGNPLVTGTTRSSSINLMQAQQNTQMRAVRNLQ